MSIVGSLTRAGAILATLAACTGEAPHALVPGLSTEADVRETHGRPEIIWEQGDGSRELQFAQRPGGASVRIVRIGPDGRLREAFDALDAARVARIDPRWQRDDLRRHFGRPAQSAFYSLSGRTLWRWPFRDETGSPRWLEIIFEASGRQAAVEVVADAPDGVAI
ncbi:MAG: hypothetical protein KDK91_21645 [Gammaproteobacteria bacterium]|nr:hypothetical protein [Gammaproteobacteria bacterium]